MNRDTIQSLSITWTTEIFMSLLLASVKNLSLHMNWKKCIVISIRILVWRSRSCPLQKICTTIEELETCNQQQFYRPHDSRKQSNALAESYKQMLLEQKKAQSPGYTCIAVQEIGNSPVFNPRVILLNQFVIVYIQTRLTED